MKEKIRFGLTFDDVLLVPKRSPVKSRKDVNLRTRLTRNISLNIPIVSANMDTVTESDMAIRMAREGGIGIIHRFMTMEDQLAQVKKVKRAESFIVENPYTLSIDSSVKDARDLMLKSGISGFLIVDMKGIFAGILSRRDLLFAVDDEKVSLVMTPKHKVVSIDRVRSVAHIRKLLHENRIEKLPIISRSGRIKGLVTSKDLRRIEKHSLALKDRKGRLMVGAAIGVKREDIKRAQALVDAGVDVLVVDIAHGHSDHAINMVKQLKKRFKTDVIAGNVATAKATADLISAGADGIKVGVGPGSICITRIVAGAGVPQLTAIMDCSREASKKKIPIIADGGIKTSGDITKALAAGASSVMCGNLFAGTDEAPGLTLLKHGVKYKVSRGMASFGAALGRNERENAAADMNDVVPEGVEAMVPYKGSAKDVIGQLTGGLRSGISYSGSSNISSMQKNAEFIRITPSGLKESKPHDVELV